MAPNDHLVDAGVLYFAMWRRRTWRERLFSAPWRPWKAREIALETAPMPTGGLVFTPSESGDWVPITRPTI